MYLQHFGLKHDPLGKTVREVVNNEQYQHLKRKLNWLLESKGVGLITGESGVGKTTALRQWTQGLNPLTHKIIYQPDNHFKPFDIFSQLAESIGLEKQHRYCCLWRNLKQELLRLYENKKVTPLWILDEAQQLPKHFLEELPAFLNFSFDTREVMVVILMGCPQLRSTLQRKIYATLTSRLQLNFEWKPLENPDTFSKFVITAFQNAGRQETIVSESGMRLIHMGSKGQLRYAHRIITRSLQMATEKNMNHLPDDIIQMAIDDLRSMTV